MWLSLESSTQNVRKEELYLSGEIVTMVQTAEPGERRDFPVPGATLVRSALRRGLLRESEVRPVVVVVMHIFGHEALEVPLIEHDDVIEQVSATTSDETLCYAVLPGAAKAAPFRLDAKALDGADDFCAEIAPTVEDQLLRGGVIRERIAQLLRPRAIRFENGKLLSQCDNPKEQPPPSAERAEDQTEENPQRSEHEAVLSENTLRKSGVKRG